MRQRNNNRRFEKRTGKLKNTSRRDEDHKTPRPFADANGQGHRRRNREADGDKDIDPFIGIIAHRGGLDRALRADLSTHRVRPMATGCVRMRHTGNPHELRLERSQKSTQKKNGCQINRNGTFLPLGEGGWIPCHVGSGGNGFPNPILLAQTARRC